MLFAEALETQKCLDEGVLTSTADANIGSIMGIGFPPYTGGSAQFIVGYQGALGTGKEAFVARARELAAKYGDRFLPPSSLTKSVNALRWNRWFRGFCVHRGSASPASAPGPTPARCRWTAASSVAVNRRSISVGSTPRTPNRPPGSERDDQQSRVRRGDGADLADVSVTVAVAHVVQAAVVDDQSEIAPIPAWLNRVTSARTKSTTRRSRVRLGAGFIEGLRT